MSYFDRCGAPGTSPLCLWLNLLGGIVLDADGINKVQLRLQPLGVFLALYDQVLKEFPCAVIALREAEYNPVLERGQSTRFQVQIPLRKLLSVQNVTSPPHEVLEAYPYQDVFWSRPRISRLAHRRKPIRKTLPVSGGGPADYTLALLACKNNFGRSLL